MPSSGHDVRVDVVVGSTIHHGSQSHGENSTRKGMIWGFYRVSVTGLLDFMRR